MSYEYERVATPASGLRLHLNENTAGCSPRRARGAAGADARRTPRSIPTTTRRSRRAPRCSASTADRCCSPTAWTRGSSRPRRGAARQPARRRSKPSSSCRRSTCTPLHRRASAAGSSRCRSAPDFEFPLDDVLAADHAAHAPRLPHEPEQPDGPAHSARRDPARSRRAAPHALVFVDEAYADFAGDTLIGDPALDGTAEPASSAARSPRRTAWPGCAPARVVGHAGRRSRRCGASCRPTASTPARPRRCRPRSPIAAYYDWYLGPGRASRKRCSTTALRPARRARTGRARRTSCSCAFGDRAPARRRRRWRRAAFTCAIARSDPGCAGCVRITAGVVEHTRGVHRGARGGPVRRARNRPRRRRKRRSRCGSRSTDADATTSRPASGSSITCWSSSRGTAGST